ncbi:MAG: hypothetical protein KDG52_14130 [Rhodocyclaceae bacterium]|nr:hypothetical protein [Rhodocyclaceae bacterium]
MARPALALALWLTWTVALAQAPSAAEVAKQASDARHIEAAFIERVARIADVPAARIRALLPGQARIAERGPWLAQAIGKQIRPLGQAEVGAILEADLARRKSLAASRRR